MTADTQTTTHDPQVELVAAGIARAADMFNVKVTSAAKNADYLRAVGVDPGNIPRGAVARAKQLHSGEPTDTQALLAATREEREAALEADTATSESQREHGPRGSGKVFDKYSVTSVLRFMGKAGWKDTKAAHRAICSLSGDDNYSMTTVRLQMKAGRDGTRGEPATLTKKEQAQLKRAAKETVEA